MVSTLSASFWGVQGFSDKEEDVAADETIREMNYVISEYYDKKEKKIQNS